MKYLAIKRDNGDVYAQRLSPDNASENPLSIEEKIILELAEKVEKLEAQVQQLSSSSDDVCQICKDDPAWKSHCTNPKCKNYAT